MNTSQKIKFNEKYLSQIPALQELINLGYTLLTPSQALKERSSQLNNVLLEDILRQQLKKINKIQYKSKEYLFSEENIQSAIQKIKNIQYNGLLKTNQEVYDLITLGTSLKQTIEGNTKSFNLKYIDWKDISNNVFHVVPEFSLEKRFSDETVRPDIVLFVNGIPFVVIECKAPHVEVKEGISQSIRNQSAEYIPKLFTYVQLIMSVNKNASMYGTTETQEKFWSIWKEDNKDKVEECINKALSPFEKDALFSGDFAKARPDFDKLESNGKRTVTTQDQSLYSLCRPERLLELTYLFTLFDSGIKKIARYQQFFVIQSLLKRIQKIESQGMRSGGIVWHTQGSGKSLTMVMLARCLTLKSEVENPRIILVTDRTNLDKQLGNTFSACGLELKQATSGKNLIRHIKNKVGIITTLIHKFEKGWSSEKCIDESKDIFVLVDESHRTHFGSMASQMRLTLPNACYIGFTGTPLFKEDKKNSFLKFGGLVEPSYPIKQAVADKAVLPLLYEARHVEMRINQKAIDVWFKRVTEDLTASQKADLKRKYAKAKELQRVDQVIYMIAYDISDHFKKNWKGTGLKAQLVAPNKISAIKYRKYLEAEGIHSEVIISGPDMREGYETVNEEPDNDVIRFWNSMMKRFGTEKEYNNQLIKRFKNNEDVDILIVVDKLLTGFDAPRNTILYLCRSLKEHNLLQAIARVNRPFEGKDFGYVIDYKGVLKELDQALTMYDALEKFDETDLDQALTSVNEEISKLAQRHSELWDTFKEVKNKHDTEALELELDDEEKRDDFYDKLFAFSKSLHIALSTEKFFENTPEEKIKYYKSDLNFFQKLKKSVQLRYADKVDYRHYDRKIKKLLDTHIQANDVTQLNKPVNIFDEQDFKEIKKGQGVYKDKLASAKADIIAHHMKRAIAEKMEEDPAFYEKFSKLIQQAIDDFKAQRLSNVEYLNTVTDLRDKFVSKSYDDFPENIKNKANACAYYGVITPYFEAHDISDSKKEDIASNTALSIDQILQKHTKVDFWDDDEAQRRAKNEIDDFLYDELEEPLSQEQINEIIDKTMLIAKNRWRR